VAIARARDRTVDLLADEPTGNLDSKTGEELIWHFEDLHRRGNVASSVTTRKTRAARLAGYPSWP
jgi:putative ABC transport system ATP-binding protein